MTLILLFMPQLVLANVITPLSAYTIPLIPLIVLVEAVVFWLLASKVMKIKVGFWKIIWAVLTANIATSLLGTFIPFSLVLPYFPYGYNSDLIWIGIAFVLSVFVEWGIYIPFFKRININASNLIAISLAGNFITYALLAVFRLI